MNKGWAMGSYSVEMLEAMKTADIQALNREELVDIRDVKINQELKQPERIQDFISKIKNPYCYRHGEFIVQIGFSGTEVSLTERLQEYLEKVSAVHFNF